MVIDCIKTGKTPWRVWGLVLLTSLLTACGGEVEMHHLVERGGQYFVKGKRTPYSGPIVAYFPVRDEDEDKRIYIEGQIENGKRVGTWIYHGWSGSKKEIRYVDGRKNGLVRWFYPRERRAGEQEYFDDRKHGGGTTWDYTGDVLTHDYYKEGTKIGYPSPEEREVREANKAREEAGG